MENTALVLGGCRSGPPLVAERAVDGVSSEQAAAVAAFEDQVRTKGSISFRTNNGAPSAHEGQRELTFYSDGTAHLLDYGIALFSVAGGYELSPSGLLVAHFGGGPQKNWEVRGRVTRGPNHLLFERLADEPDDTIHLWPYASLSGDDEAAVSRTNALHPTTR